MPQLYNAFFADYLGLNFEVIKPGNTLNLIALGLHYPVKISQCLVNDSVHISHLTKSNFSGLNPLMSRTGKSILLLTVNFCTQLCIYTVIQEISAKSQETSDSGEIMLRKLSIFKSCVAMNWRIHRLLHKGTTGKIYGSAYIKNKIEGEFR